MRSLFIEDDTFNKIAYLMQGINNIFNRFGTLMDENKI